MKLARIFRMLCALVILGGMIGFYLSSDYPLPKFLQAIVEEPERAPVEPVAFDIPEMPPDAPVDMDLEFPEGAIEGELVLHFQNRDDYLAYIAALMESGLSPLGKIDELLALRVPEDALLLVDLEQYGARTSFSYWVERPLPPVQMDPAALAGLRAYGISARRIVNGAPFGDGSGVTVAILDSGIEAHPHFEGLHRVSIDLAGGGVDGPGAAHGTSVASIITGQQGIVPNAELLVVRVLDDQGFGNSYHLADGIIQAVDLGVQVINFSLAAYQDAPLLRQAVQYAADHDVIMVAAAGNEGFAALPYPAAYESVLSVTALDANGLHAGFPNQSVDIDFAAPGVGISTANEDHGTTLFSGTSAATPFVSGTLVSLLSGDAPVEPAAAIKLMKRYLNDAGAPGDDPVYGAGVVDWDRLREHGELGIRDIALAGIHLSPEAQPGTTMPVQVTVQNRGTTWLSGARLEVVIEGAEPVGFSIGNLAVGETTTRKVFARIPSLSSEQSLSLAARVLPVALNQDVRPENNYKLVQFRPR